jgi:hypothetical protein
MNSQSKLTRAWAICPLLLTMLALLLFAGSVFAQETTGGLQGTIKDPTGAVVSKAHVVITGSTLVGTKDQDTDAAGYYRFANLPPGTYAITVTAKGFKTAKREGVPIEVGHLPSVDIPMEVGGTDTVVEVSGEAPIIDVTTTRTMTNVTEDVLQDVPRGRSFQSVIQFAPSARNEPLAGSMGSPEMSMGNGTGGQSAGSGGNGQAYGFSVAGGADSENGYLVEGQETADAIGGFSHSNVPIDFIQEVQVKSSGIEAEHGGALGGVINVIMKKGGNQFHGSVFSTFEDGGWDGSPTAYSRYDPTYVPTVLGSGTSTFYQDPNYQQYQATRDKTRDNMPGFTIGGPILKDRLWFFAGFNPELKTDSRVVGMSSNTTPCPLAGSSCANYNFSRNQQTYYTTARVDAAITQKMRVFGSWLYQYQKETGEGLPYADSVNGYPNLSSTSAPFVFAHGLGYGAPNVTTNVGMDYTITPRLVGTVRWGYNFQNYHDFGYPTTGNLYLFQASGVGAFENCTPQPCTPSTPITGQLAQVTGYVNAPYNGNTTTYDASHRNQIDADIAWFKSGLGGTHNFKFGYQLMRLSNTVLQHWNEPASYVFPGAGNNYVRQGTVGADNCAPYVALYGACAGLDGYLYAFDYGSYGDATSNNNAFFAQDAWTIGRGITINAGIRFEHEYLPAEDQPAGGISKPIQFGWGDKVVPRVGAAWDVFRNGKMKVFGSYGAFTDVMKLNLAISSFGGQYWQNCYYAMNTNNLSSFDPVFGNNSRYCVGPNSASEANFPNGVTPAGFTFLENQNFRTFPTSCATCTATEEGVAPNLKPYRQHESVFGVDYQLQKNLAFEARWDRRRLDDVIEDSAIFDPAIGETFVIVNPGKGINQTFNGFWNFLYGTPSGCGTTTNPCPPNNVPGARSYDGVELRLTRPAANHWGGMFSYTYSHFRGNYTGLTSTDIGDGGGGRNAPNNSRSFDEPIFQYNAQGSSSSGLLPTDRPNTFKGYAYYELNWMKKMTSDFGLFQVAYQGTPQTTIMDTGYAFGPPLSGFPTDVVDRGKWVNMSQDLTTGAITVGNPSTYRTPWYTQTDFNFQQSYKVAEAKSLTFTATLQNIFNQRAITAYYPFADTQNFAQFLSPVPGGITAGVPGYYGLMTGYNFVALANSGTQGNTPCVAGCSTSTPTTSGIMTLNSQYGKPYIYQLARNIRLGINFTF